jgi:4-hydroxybenzoate polyprenyltransferase
MSLLLNPTFRLLTASAPVGFSGALRVYIAFLLAGIAPYLLPCLASGLIIYATYTLDRAIPCAEDEVNQGYLASANRRLGVAWCVLAYLLGAALLFREGIFLVPLLPLVIGYLYTKGLTVGSHTFKLKGGAGMKNAVIGLTWGGSIALVVAHWTVSPVIVIPIFLFYGLKLFINSTLFDIKDLQGDLAAGIRTIPAYLGERGAKYLLTALSLCLHGAMAFLILKGLLRPEVIILGYSCLIGVVFISFYSTEWERRPSGVQRHFRQIAIQGESGIALALRFLTGVAPAVLLPGYV